MIKNTLLSDLLANCAKCKNLDSYALYTILKKYGLRELPKKEWSKEIISAVNERYKQEKGLHE